MSAEKPSESCEIRVFLSSTFRDFMQERDLLVKQVFPELRRKARDRGVEVVDVDLRWGITEEESRQGKVIPICLGEIDRCRPYFVGMLGERYGWIPPSDQYSPEVIERQPWLTQHLGGVSVTELEILHGVLNDPAMAGRAFFYFRDHAWSTSQSEPGFICESAEEEAKLTDLKQRIRNSGFPVTEKLPDPKALADQIGSDLWELIEQQYPDLDEADALEREERQHASYRRSRLGVHLGGKRSINQLERWIDAGQQKILITGESGAGKSALIANWIEAHQQHHPEDVVFAHHLGCSIDASATRPLLARLIETAKQQLPEVYGYSLSVPQDWWELVAKAVEALQSLGRWAQQNNHRWIWVLDGLDRLDPDDQKALPWLPLTIPQSVVIIASALECPAREILLERRCKKRTIGPLKAKEQDALIKQYLGRYTKQLIAELRQTILNHPLAGSPLFLRVLLEELRQCGRYETLAEQLAGYLSAETIGDLYERVLERLEADGNGDNVRKVMTALWASRAGLGEEELLSITGLKPLEWAPIDLSLEQALGRNGNRLVFDHNYLRKAVENRYLPTEDDQRQAHSVVADWFEARDEWDERVSEELPWELLQAKRLKELSNMLMTPRTLARIGSERGSKEIIYYWLGVRDSAGGGLDELIEEAVNEEISKNEDDAKGMMHFTSLIADVLEEAGFYRKLLLNLRSQSLIFAEQIPDARMEALGSRDLLGTAYLRKGELRPAKELLKQNLKEREMHLGVEHLDTLNSAQNLASIYLEMGNYEKARYYYESCLRSRERVLGEGHHQTLTTAGSLGLVVKNQGDYPKAEALMTRCVTGLTHILGDKHLTTVSLANNLASLYQATGKYEKARIHYSRCLDSCKQLLGSEHPTTLVMLNNLAGLLQVKGEHEMATTYFAQCLHVREKILGSSHPDTLSSVHNLGMIYWEIGNYKKAKKYLNQCLNRLTRLVGKEHPNTLTTMCNLGLIHMDSGELDKAQAYIVRAHEIRQEILGCEHPDTLNTLSNLGLVYSEKHEIEKAEECYVRCLEIRERVLGLDHPDTLITINNLGVTLKAKGEINRAKACYLRCLEGRSALLGEDHPETTKTLANLLELYREEGDATQVISLVRRKLDFYIANYGDNHAGTLSLINELAIELRDSGNLEEAEALFHKLLDIRRRSHVLQDVDTGRVLAGLSKTLELLDRLEESATTALRAVDCLIANNCQDPILICLVRVGLARVLQKLSRTQASLGQLDEAEEILCANKDHDESVKSLHVEIRTLRLLISRSTC